MTSKRRSCFTEKGRPKLRFNTRAEAKAWERELMAKYPNNKPLGQYRCPFCGYFHNGTYPSDPEAREGKRALHHVDDTMEHSSGGRRSEEQT